jgi:hypothetical protein
MLETSRLTLRQAALPCQIEFSSGTGGKFPLKIHSIGSGVINECLFDEGSFRLVVALHTRSHAEVTSIFRKISLVTLFAGL